MAQIKITKRSVDAIKPAEKPAEYRDTELKGFLIRCQPTGNKTFYFSYRNAAGKARRIKLGKYGDITPDQARTQAKDAAGRVASGQDPQRDKKEKKTVARKKEASKLGAFIEQKYSPWAEKHNKGGKNDVKRLKTCFQSWWDKPLMSINTWLVGTWRTAQLNRGRAVSGINRDVARLKGVLTKAVESKVIENSPLAGFKDLKTDTKKKPRFFSQEEEQQLKSALRERDQRTRKDRVSFNQWLKARGKQTQPEISGWYADYLEPLVITALNTGMRRGELFSFRWSSVDFRNRMITVTGGLAKSGKTRFIPINDNLLTTLKAWKKQSDSAQLVFPSPVTGERLDNIKSSWGRIDESSRPTEYRNYISQFETHFRHSPGASKRGSANSKRPDGARQY